VQLVTLTLPPDSPWSFTETAQREFLFPTAENNSFVLHRFGTTAGFAKWRAAVLRFITPASEKEAEAYRTARRSDLFRRSPAAQVRDSSPFGPAVLMTVQIEERNTPALFGAGLIETITSDVFEEIAAKQSCSPIRGRVPYLEGGRVGRFGWKAQNATLLDFNENACAVELGLETPRRHQARSPVEAPASPTSSKPARGGRTEPPATIPDITDDECRALTAFTASLPAPAAVVPKDSQPFAVAGERLFSSLGCSECHVPILGSISGIYSDLLLHRVGSRGEVSYGALSEGVEAGKGEFVPARSDEFRTPPLWGVADSAPYLHDGSAPTLHDAILAHAGQATDSRERYRGALPADRRALLTFLSTLRAPPTDP
jgi:CxxC motif-containing protein (DUF1111 family)